MLTGLLAVHNILLLGRFGGMDRAASREVAFIPVEMAHKNNSEVLQFSMSRVLKNEVAPRLPALLL